MERLVARQERNRLVDIGVRFDVPLHTRKPGVPGKNGAILQCGEQPRACLYVTVAGGQVRGWRFCSAPAGDDVQLFKSPPMLCAKVEIRIRSEQQRRSGAASPSGSLTLRPAKAHRRTTPIETLRNTASLRFDRS